ncbi:single-stranded DNA-binding protein [Mucilaginibacter sp. UC70_90]
MQQVTGRLTADATVKTLESGKTVVNFSIAENQRYKPKGSEDYVNIPTFFNCSNWLGAGIAEVLRKGTSVILNGRISARTYQTNTGDWAAALNFHTNRIEVQAYAPTTTTGAGKNAPAPEKDNKNKAGKEAAIPDDLPF